MRLDALLTNARISTLDPDVPRATTMGVLGGRIVGFDEDVADLPSRTVIDADGAAVLPGFYDAHCHTAWFGLTLSAVDLADVPGDLPAIYSRLREAAAITPPGEWIIGTGITREEGEESAPDIAELDRIADGRPLMIRQSSGHAAFANTEALRLAGILEPQFSDPEGGRVVRDAHGRPTGLVEETAQALIQDLIRPYSTEQLVGALDRATSRYAREGITSFTEAGIAGGWIGHSPLELAAYQAARDSGVLRARAQLMPSVDALHPITGHPDDPARFGLDLGLRTGFGDDRLSIGPVKVFMDGALSSETAALTRPYADRAHTGYLQAPADVLHRQIIDAYAAGWSLAVHAIGDAAIDEAIAAIAEAQRLHGRRARPNRIEHASVTREDQIPLLAEHGIAVTPQSAFFSTVGDAMAAGLGPERTRGLYRAKSFLDAGILLAGSSDRPCADGSVLGSIQAYAERLTRSGAVIGPDELITPAQAVWAYTMGAATAAGHEADRGSLSPGKLADAVILADDPSDVPVEEIAQIAVHGTLLGGVPVTP